MPRQVVHVSWAGKRIVQPPQGGGYGESDERNDAGRAGVEQTARSRARPKYSGLERFISQRSFWGHFVSPFDHSANSAIVQSVQKPSLRLCVRRAVMAADVCRMQRPRACSTFRVAHPTRPCQESDLNFESSYCILVCVLVLSWVLCGTWARRRQRRGLASPSPQYNPNFSNHLHHQSYLAPFRRGEQF